VIRKPPADPRARLGKALKKLRLAAGMSQEELAAVAGIHRNYAGAVERGEKNIALLNLTKIAGALQIPLSRLIREMEKQ
jgi:transcriptional regulator with XRE-family HTH domain